MGSVRAGSAARGGAVRLFGGRFEAQFEDPDAARAAARDALAVGFVVHVEQTATGWIAIGRRRLTFPGDERDRYAQRFQSIATQHGGAFIQFVEEPSEATVIGGATRTETPDDEAAARRRPNPPRGRSS